MFSPHIGSTRKSRIKFWVYRYDGLKCNWALGPWWINIAELLARATVYAPHSDTEALEKRINTPKNSSQSVYNIYLSRNQSVYMYIFFIEREREREHFRTTGMLRVSGPDWV